MKTLATAVAMTIVLSVPVAAKTVLNNPQRVMPDYAASGIKGEALARLKLKRKAVSGTPDPGSGDIEQVQLAAW